MNIVALEQWSTRSFARFCTAAHSLCCIAETFLGQSSIPPSLILTCSFTVLHSCLYSVLQAGAEAAPYPEGAELPLPLLYWLWALLAILWLRPKLRRRPAYWDSREKGLASMLRRHTEAQTSCNVERGQITYSLRCRSLTALAIFMLDTRPGCSRCCSCTCLTPTGGREV